MAMTHFFYLVDVSQTLVDVHYFANFCLNLPKKCRFLLYLIFISATNFTFIVCFKLLGDPSQTVQIVFYQQLILLSFSFSQLFLHLNFLSLKLTQQQQGTNLTRLWRWNKMMIMIIPWRRNSSQELPMNKGKSQTNATYVIMHLLGHAI